MLKKANNFFVFPCFFKCYLDEMNSYSMSNNLTSYIGVFIIIIFITFVLEFHIHVYKMNQWVELAMCM